MSAGSNGLYGIRNRDYDTGCYRTMDGVSIVRRLRNKSDAGMNVSGRKESECK